MLREVAGVIRQSTRSEDLVARYGGEEFVVALPIAAPDQAHRAGRAHPAQPGSAADRRERDHACR